MNRSDPGGPSRALAQMDRLGEAVDQVGLGSGIDRGGTGSSPDHPHPRDTLDRVRIRAHGDVLVGVLADDQQADRALGMLRRAGFGPGQLGLAVCCGTLVRTSGSLAVAGCADAGPFAALVAMGIPAAEAGTYQRAFEACRAIVTVRAGARVQEGLALLHATADLRRAPLVIDPRPVKPQPADRHRQPGRTHGPHRPAASGQPAGRPRMPGGRRAGTP